MIFIGFKIVETSNNIEIHKVITQDEHSDPSQIEMTAAEVMREVIDTIMPNLYSELKERGLKLALQDTPDSVPYEYKGSEFKPRF